MTSKQFQAYRQWLLELTSLPTAAGCESRVIDWITAWAKRRKCVALVADRYGNLVLERRGTGSKRRESTSNRPIYITAHMDHPAFVVREVLDDRQVIADFRGGVRDEYFVGSKVRWHGTLHAGDKPVRTQRGEITSLSKAVAPSEDKQCTIRFSGKVDARPGDVVTWDIAMSKIRGDRLRAPVCDDLAALAAALAAFDALNKRKSVPDVRLLLTRCEEVGFIGTIGACKNKTVPRNAVVVTLENSKSFPESPIGGGPIIRVGDRISTFNHEVNFRIQQIATKLEQKDKTFQFQRKLMPGGACEATAFQDFGYDATCLCLPLGNYHNMNEKTGRIDAETISVCDFENMVKLLVAVGVQYNAPDRQEASLRKRLDKLFASRKDLIATR